VDWVVRVFLLWLFSLPVVCTTVYADFRFIDPEVKTVPRYFYHWIEPESLEQEWRLETLKTKGILPLPWMKETFFLVTLIPGLEMIPGLFVWPHPVTGMATGPKEIYGTVPILIEMTSEPVRVLELRTDEHYLFEDAFNIERVDLIHHSHFEIEMKKAHWWSWKKTPHEVLQWEEWIIVNPKVVTQFTADPKYIKDRIRYQLEKLKLGEKYPLGLIHFKASGRKMKSDTQPLFNSRVDRDEFILPVLNDYLKMDSSEIHPLWRRPFKKRPCPQSLQQLGNST